jgi:hypothetical protein
MFEEASKTARTGSVAEEIRSIAAGNLWREGTIVRQVLLF